MNKTTSVILCVTSALAAQGTVMPPWLARSPGSGTTNWPFGLDGPCRVQYVYDASETGLAAPSSITAFELRAEQDVANSAKGSIDLEVAMSQTPTTMATLQAAFADNRGSNHAVVFARRMISLPATTPQVFGNWTPPFVLDAPFPYDPTTNQSLLIEYDVASQPSGTWQVDCAWSAPGVHFAIGTGCNGLSATSYGGRLDEDVQFIASGGEPGSAGALLLGVSEWPVPIPVPGSPGCYSFTSLDVIVPRTVGVTGLMWLAVQLPNDRNLLGQPVHGQLAALNAGLTLDTTPSRRVFLTALDSVGRVANITSNTSATGIVQKLVAMVTRLR